MIDKIEYYRLRNYIQTEIINNKIKNNSKINGNLFGGSSINFDELLTGSNHNKIVKDIINNSVRNSSTRIFVEDDLYNNVICGKCNEVCLKNSKIEDLHPKCQVCGCNNASHYSARKKIVKTSGNNLQASQLITTTTNNDETNPYWFPITYIKEIYNKQEIIGKDSVKNIIIVLICYLIFLISAVSQKADTKTTNLPTLKEQLFDILKIYFTPKLNGGSQLKSYTSTIVKGAIGIGILYYIADYIEAAFVEFTNWYNSPNKTISSFFKMLSNILSNSSIDSKIVDSYSFNEGTGMIECDYKQKFNTIITKLTHSNSDTEKCNLGEIEMTTTHDIYTKKNKITYTVNSIILDSITYIESKPVSTALVMTYICAKKELFTIKKNPQDYIYEITSDNVVKLYEKNTQKEIISVSAAINQFKDNLEEIGGNTMKHICKDIFQVEEGLKNENCSKHFFSILGGSGLSMLENIGEIAKTNIEIKKTLKNANPLIKYEIIKNLNWKMKVNNNNKYLISLEDWLKIIKKPEYKKYLDSENGLIVKEIIIEMVNDINTNTSLLEKKYEKTITNPNYYYKKEKKLRLNKKN